jgi:translation initiation factor IF-2
MRARGANVTDIAVLVVAADDGVMPQTEEAIDHARAANVAIVVALNKCDKPEANPTRVRQELAKLGLQPEEWGGDTVTVDVSAVTGKGVDELVEMLALVAELKELKANPKKPARGTVLDAMISGSRGPVATVLVQDGTLHVGDVIVCGATFGRVKALFDDRDRPLREAGPSWPVAVVGLTALPQAGDRLVVMDDFQKARAIAEERQSKARELVMTRREHVSLENLFTSIAAGHVQELRLIVKGDVRGTVDALQKVLASIVSPEVKLHILRASVGAISTSDVLLGDASDALVLGLNVVPDTVARALAEQKGVAIHTYNVIYRVKEDIERALAGMLAPEEREVVAGHADVRKVFRTSRAGTVAGCYVRDGIVARNHRVRLVRDGAVVFTGRVGSLRRGKDDVRDVREGFECGIRIENYDDVKEGDVIETFQVEKIARTLGASAGAPAAPAKPA